MLLRYSMEKNHTLSHSPNTPNAAAKRLPFYVTSSAHFKCDQTYFTEREGLHQYLLAYTLSGCGAIQYRNIEALVPKHHAFVIDCREYQYYKTSAEEWEFLWVHFNGTSAGEYFDLINGNSFEVINTGNDSQIATLLLEIQTVINSKTELIDVKLSPIVHALLTQILLHNFTSMNNTNQQRHKDAIDHTIAYINQHYALPISIDELAENVNISKYYLIKLFKAFTGQTPYDYLIGYRINASKKLLKETDESVKTIALKVGFNDIKNYIKAFKNLTGTTPLNYRLYWI